MTKYISKIESTYLIFSFLFFIILYFYDFNQGDSSAPLALRSIKEVLFIIISALLVLNKRIHKSAFIYLWAYIVLISIYSALFSKNVTFFLEGKSLILYMCVSFFWFQGDTKDYFFKIKNPLIFFQLGLSLVTYFLGLHLWEEKEFVGTMGNPNCSGLFANIVFFLTLNQKQLKKWDLAALVASLVCVLFCKALSQQLIFLIAVGINSLFLILKRDFFRLKIVLGSILVFLLVCLTTTAVNTYVLIGLLNKISITLFDIEFIYQEQASLSITGRVSNFIQIQKIYENGSLTEILFGFARGDYFKSDALYFIFAINYGLVGLMLFLTLLVRLTYKGTMQAFRFKEPAALLFILIFSLTFIFTRALYYFPVCILFYILYDYFDKKTYIKHE